MAASYPDLQATKPGHGHPRSALTPNTLTPCNVGRDGERGIEGQPGSSKEWKPNHAQTHGDKDRAREAEQITCRNTAPVFHSTP
jgi:hypothetical protein